jgi:hypothetical protein
MTTAIKLAFQFLGVLLLCQISPLGACVALALGVLRLASGSGALRHLVALVLHDILRAIWHWCFGPPRVQVARPTRRVR